MTPSIKTMPLYRVSRFIYYYAESLYAEYHYAERRHADCRVAL
jgi:hypothetical protein